MAQAPKPEEVKKEEFKSVKLAKALATEIDFTASLDALVKSANENYIKAHPIEAPPKPVPVVNKAEAKTLFETAFKRLKAEDTTPAEFDYFFNKIPQVEKDKEPVTVEALKARIIEYADEIHFRQTKDEAAKDKVIADKKVFDEATVEVKKGVQDIKDP